MKKQFTYFVKVLIKTEEYILPTYTYCNIIDPIKTAKRIKKSRKINKKATYMLNYIIRNADGIQMESLSKYEIELD